MTCWNFTNHALTRAVEMLVTADEILAVLDAPEVSYAQGVKYPGRELWMAGRIVLAIDPKTRVVYTVLWRGKESRAAGPFVRKLVA